MDVPDTVLVNRWVQHHDQEAFAEIVRRYTAMVTGLIRSILGDAGDLDDLVQETFLDGYLKLETLHRRERLGPWLAQVAQNHARMWLRTRERRESKHTRFQADMQQRPLSEPTGDTADLSALWEAIGQLTYNTRIVTVLYYIDGVPQAEIARFLGISGASVRQRLYQARQRLRQIYPAFVEQPPERRMTASDHVAQTVIPKGTAQMASTPTILEKHTDGEKTQYLTLSLFDKLLQNRIIQISSIIDDDTATRVVAQMLYLQSLNRHEPVYMYITSRGGDLMAGMAIYDTMQYLASEVHTYCVGHASGIATLLLAGGSPGHRYILPNAGVMIHQPDPEQVEDIMELHEERAVVKFRTKTHELLAAHTGKSREEVEKDARRGVFLTAEDAQNYGLVDTIVGK